MEKVLNVNQYQRIISTKESSLSGYSTNTFPSESFIEYFKQILLYNICILYITISRVIWEVTIQITQMPDIGLRSLPGSVRRERKVTV